MAVELERYLREEQVLQYTTLSHATMWREIKAGRFPKQIRLSLAASAGKPQRSANG